MNLLARLASMLLVLWGVVTMTFVVNYALPGDPARAIAGPQARPADLVQIRKAYGLDRSLAVQYALFAKRLVHLGPSHPDPRDEAHRSCSTFGALHLDLGTSYQKGKPVAKLLADRFPATLLLAVAATLVQVLLGVVTGTFAAVRKNTIFDHGTVALTLLGISAPTFLLGVFLQWVLAAELRLVPLDGYGATFGERLGHVILPALTLGLFGAAYYTRLVRDEVLTQRAQDYARTAFAKGATRARVIGVHVLRNALMPLVTVVGVDLGVLVGGAIVTEKLFRWPGLGALSVDAVADRDGPVIMGTVIVASSAVIVASLVVDMSYALLDPRARGAGK